MIALRPRHKASRLRCVAVIATRSINAIRNFLWMKVASICGGMTFVNLCIGGLASTLLLVYVTEITQVPNKVSCVVLVLCMI